MTRAGDTLQALLDTFQHVYNDERPHRAIARRTPAEAHTALPKDQPSIELLERHWRVRHDIADSGGKTTVRWAGKLRHLAIGRAHAHARIVILLAGRDTLVIRADTGEIIAEHTLDEARNYQPRITKTPPEGGVQ